MEKENLTSVFDQTASLSIGQEVMKITQDGRIFWRGREVEGDDDFRAAMIDVAAYFKVGSESHLRVIMERDEWRNALTRLCLRFPKNADDAEQQVRSRVKGKLSEPIQQPKPVGYVDWSGDLADVVFADHVNPKNTPSGTKLYTGPQVPEGMTLVPTSALKWLNGEGDDFEPDRKGAYWWRSKFRELCAAAPQSGVQQRDCDGAQHAKEE